MKRMVVGFLYNDSKTQVILIKKNKPEWQRGIFNGVGGKIEEGESPFYAMKREFNEEANLEIDNWKHFATLTNKIKDWTVYFFSVIGSFEGLKSLTDEEVYVFDIDKLPDNIVYNVKWLIPLGLDKLIHNFNAIEVEYHD